MWENAFIMMMLSYLRKILIFLVFLRNFHVSFSWKVAGNIPSVDLHLSDTRLFQIIHHMQSIPFPESKTPAITETPYESEVRK